MASKSDHDDNRIDVNKLLPEVYKSDVNQTLFEASVNKLLTKDDTVHVSGYIGQRNNNLQINRQLTESTPHRQAYQLSPVIYNTIGSTQHILTYKGFQQQLSLMGVDINEMDKWASTTSFNWVPPVNLDMLVNYTDYFWKPPASQQLPQYFTIENKCNKSTSQLEAYNTIINRRGATMQVISINFADNAFVITGKQTDLFTPGFTFVTKNSSSPAIEMKTWVVTVSEYDVTTDQTRVVVDADIAIRTIANPQDTIEYPSALYEGQLFYRYNTSTTSPLSQLFVWNGVNWVGTTPSIPCVISLTEQQAIYQSEANCNCVSTTGGWDQSLWDDSQQGSEVWNADLLGAISFATAAEWITFHDRQPSHGDIWHDTNTDALKTYTSASNTWAITQTAFSSILAETTGVDRWDATVGCTPQLLNQWSSNNFWVHKSELSSFVGTYRANAPIMEYASNIEMSKWVKTIRHWKYRADLSRAFEYNQSPPSRLELEPIKSYIVTNIDGVWYMYLGSNVNSANRDINYTSTFVPGFKFKIVDNISLNQPFTVHRSWYREAGSADPIQVPRNQFITVVQLVEDEFDAPLEAGIVQYDTALPQKYTRIEPITTSQGHAWLGYHQHWVLDKQTQTVPSSNQPLSPHYKAGLSQTPITVPNTQGSLVVTDVYQEFIPNVDMNEVKLHQQFWFNPNTPGFYAVAGENQLRVYINGIRQYGNYNEVTSSVLFDPAGNPGPHTRYPDYTLINGLTPTPTIATIPIRYVQSIQFNTPVSAGDVVRIEIAPPALTDNGLYSVPVRTIENDAAFASAVQTKQQPLYKSLASYVIAEQTKTKLNQYPQFNKFDVITGELISTTSIFGFLESDTMPVDPSTQMRIVKSADSREFEFEQHLVEESNGMMYAYRELNGNIPTLWFNPMTQMLKQWDGTAWNQQIVVTLSTGMCVYQPVVSSIEPIQLHDQHLSFWVNPLTDTVYQRDSVHGIWNVIDDVYVNTADPTLRTIWKTTPHQYIPQYVDDNRQPLSKGNTAGDWEIVSQWKNNPEHENHKTVLLSQLSTHIRSIIAGQPQIPGLPNNGIFAFPQSNYRLGEGGTIKEHNDSFDTLISAVAINEVSPIGVIEFAQSQYASNMVTVRELFDERLVSALIDYSGYSIPVIASNIIDQCINDFSMNEYISSIYGDTNSYDDKSQTGIKNWIATAPMFGLVPRVHPHVLVSNNDVNIQHHDGHRTTLVTSAAIIDKQVRLLVKQMNNRTPGSAVIQNTQPTSTGVVYWYNPYGSTKLLYKHNGTNGWDIISIQNMLAELFLTIEMKLYEASPPVARPMLSMTDIVEDQQYQRKLNDRFNQYATSRNISAPLSNTSYNLQDPYTWNYAYCINDVPPRNDVVPEPRSCWQSLYEMWYGTPYPHLEPWKLQGYTNKPTWWDDEYKDTTGTRRWKYDHATKIGMWENIRLGIVPVGRYYPSMIISSGNSEADGISMPIYNYFSVNVSDDVIAGDYAPDDMLPPYYDSTLIAGIHPTVRTIYRTFTTQIVSTSADYVLGQKGPSEWEWTVSGEYVYDRIIAMFMVSPVKFLRNAFGAEFVTVDQLQIDVRTKKVFNHKDVLFHGDVYDTNKIYKAAGLNQWYVNYNRYHGFDTNKTFRDMWVDWTPKQAYQTGGTISTSSLQLFNANFDVTEKDYNVVLANTGVIRDIWLDSFNVSILSIPPAIIQHNNQGKWKLAITSPSQTSRDVRYYGTQVWPVVIDENNTIHAFRFKIVDVDASINTCVVGGDQTPFCIAGEKISISLSSTNDGNYTIMTSVFDPIRNVTRIRVDEDVPTSVRDGVIDLYEYSHNWETGTIVRVSSDVKLPYGVDGSTPYYVIKLDDLTFKLADTLNNAELGISMDIIQPPVGLMEIGKIKSSFQVYGGSSNSADLWLHYELNYADVRTQKLPATIVGMQSLINFVDGYVELQADLGVTYNDTAQFVEYDNDTGNPVSWQLEVERFIDWAYGLQRSRLQLNDRHEIVVEDENAGLLRFTTSAPSWTQGTKVSLSTTGSLPYPLMANTTPYYMVPTDDPQLFRLSTTSRIDDHFIVDGLSVGSGVVYISLFTRDQTFPSFEINPMRNNVWINTPQGMLADVISGPYLDVRINQKIYDQYGRDITADKLIVYRHDRQTRLTLRENIPNDVELYPAGFNDPYNFIHVSGGHLFIEGYEHIILFNNYTVGDDLMFDPFLGLQVNRFDVDFKISNQISLRPTIGGYYLTNNKFVRNIEGSIQDIRNYYDAYNDIDDMAISRYSRHLLGYGTEYGGTDIATTDTMSYLDLLNINKQSQFLFYRGMIQSKGSINSIKAYINNRKFVDAKVDEFWAYKVGEFGDTRAKVYPHIKLYDMDRYQSDVRFKFIQSQDSSVEYHQDIAHRFNIVSFRDGYRWADYPSQKTDIQSPLFLDGSISSKQVIYITHGTDDYIHHQPTTGQQALDRWIHVSHGPSTVVSERVWIDGEWVLTSPISNFVGLTGYIKLHHACDGVRVVHQRLTAPGILNDYVTDLMDETSSKGFTRVNSEVIKVNSLVYQYSVMDYNSDTNTTTLTVVSDRDPRDETLIVSGDVVLYTGGIARVQTVSELDENNQLTITVNGQLPNVNGNIVIGSCVDVLNIYTIRPAVDKISPVRLLDTQSHTVITTIPMWHPAYGHHTQTSIQHIDHVCSFDPAQYMVTNDEYNTTQTPWTSNEAGTVWLDTNMLEYLPYYDDKIMPSVNDRIFNWGKRPSWSDLDVYVWTETTIPPATWDSVVVSQQSDSSIATADKISGTPKQSIFKRTRQMDVASIIDPLNGVVRLDTLNTTYVNGMTFMFNVDELYTGDMAIDASQQYYVSDYDISTGLFTVVDGEDNVMDLTGTPTPLYVVPPFTDEWQRQSPKRERIYAALSYVFGTDRIFNPVITLASDVWNTGDVVSVFVNGVEVMSSVVDTNNVVSTSALYITENDIIDVVHKPVVTEDQLMFNPDDQDDGKTLEQWTLGYDYSVRTKHVNGSPVSYYYYWVKDSVTRGLSNISPNDIASHIDTPPTPYAIIQEPQDEKLMNGWDVPPWETTGWDKSNYVEYNKPSHYMMSVFYHKAIITGIMDYIVEDDRFVLEFTRDLTLRRTLTDKSTGSNVKNKHEKWLMFRRDQVGAVPKELWVKMTESLMRTKYDDVSALVPSLERDQYDTLNGTKTRFGFDDGQAFVDHNWARLTFIAYMQNPNNDFGPVDINEFFQRYPIDRPSFWTNPVSVREMCDYVYNTFNTQHTNGLWFEILSDAMASQTQYRGLMKTSWLAIHGIRILDVDGTLG